MDQNDLQAIGLPENVLQEITKPEVLAKFDALIEQSKEGLLKKNNELLAKHTELNGFIQSMGGKDALKALSEQASKAKAESEAAALRSGDVEAIKSQYQNQLSAVAKERDSFKSKYVDREVNRSITEAIRSAKGAPALLEPLVRARIAADVTEDGDVRLNVLNANGSPMLTSDGQTATLKDLLAEFRSHSDYARAFEPNKSGGSGAVVNPEGVPQGQNNPWNPATRNLTEQSKLVTSNPQMAKLMAAQYGVDLKF
jgi:Skp family chaperone for outer membrane proteins